MIRFNKKGIAEFLDVIFVILFFLFFVIALLIALFSKNTPISKEAESTIFLVQEQQTLDGLLRTPMNGMSMAEFIATKDLSIYENKQLLENTIKQRLEYTQNINPNSAAAAEEFKTPLYYFAASSSSNQLFKINENFPGSTPKITQAIPSQNGIIIIEFGLAGYLSAKEMQTNEPLYVGGGKM
jgi:hypothetical protein